MKRTWVIQYVENMEPVVLASLADLDGAKAYRDGAIRRLHPEDPDWWDVGFTRTVINIIGRPVTYVIVEGSLQDLPFPLYMENGEKLEYFDNAQDYYMR